MNDIYAAPPEEGGKRPVIYLMDIACAADIPEAYCERYFPKRYERALRYRFSEDRDRCVCAGALLHEIVKPEERDIRYNRYGKPFTDAKGGFSLSHSGRYTALAVCPAEIGVDIEQTGRRHSGAMPYIFSDGEISFAGEDNSRFCTLWTLKESLAKAEGSGLTRSMRDVTVMPFLNGDAVFYAGRSWYGSTLTVDDGRYIVSCVSEIKAEPCIIRITDVRDFITE